MLGKFGHRLEGAASSHNQDERDLGQGSHMFEVTDWIECKRLKKRRRSGQGRKSGRDQNRVTVRLGPRHEFGCDVSEGARLIYDDDGRSETILELSRIEPSQRICARTGQEAVNCTDVTGRPRSLCKTRSRNKKQRRQ